MGVVSWGLGPVVVLDSAGGWGSIDRSQPGILRALVTQAWLPTKINANVAQVIASVFNAAT